MSGIVQPKKNSRVVWSIDDENRLIDLWQENIEKLRGAKKNSHIYQEITEKLKESGFCGTWSDVRTKVDNLTRKYRQEKNKIGPTGGAPSLWQHYHKINNILGSFRLHNIAETMHESTDISTLLEESQDVFMLDPEDFALDQSSTSSCIVSENGDNQCSQPKKRKYDTNAELIKLARERNDMQRQMHQERKQQIDEIVQSLKGISSQNASFQTELLSILREKK